MSEEEKQHIRLVMQNKTTDELRDIWRTRDESEWTAVTLEIVRDLLLERLDEPPDQASDADGRETSYNADRLIGLALWIAKLSWLFLVLFVLQFAAIVVYIVRLAELSGADLDFPLVFFLFVTLLTLPATGMLYFFGLRGFSEFAFLFMDIEENTRRAARGRV